MTSNVDTNNRSFTLRPAVIPSSPIFLLPAIFVIISLAHIPYMIRTHDLSPLWLSMIGVVVFVVPIIYMNARYRVWWKDGTLIMRAGGFAGVVVTMEAKDIERIKQETSNARTFARMNRPV